MSVNRGLSLSFPSFIFTAAAFLLSVILFVVFKPALLFVFPGMLLFHFFQNRNINAMESTIFSVVLSLSYWIVSFWILKYIQIPFSVFIDLTLVLSMAYFAFAVAVKGVTIKKMDTPLLVFSLLVIALFVPFYTNYLSSPGADMATQTYIARHIKEVNGFPNTFEPVLPVDSFGSAPMGLSIVAAAVSLSHNVPTYKSTLLVAVIAYIMVGIGFFMFINTWFSPSVSALTTLTIGLYNHNVTEYFVWGGNMTVMAIGFILIALTFLMRLAEKNGISVAAVFVLAIYVYASFTVHHIPLIAAFYLLPFFGMYVLIKKPRYTKYFLLFLSTLGLLSLPFLSLLKIPPSSSVDIVRDWQGRVGPNWLEDDAFAIPVYLRDRYGDGVIILLVLGLILAARSKIKHKYWFYFSVLLSILLLINNKYWLLPLSPLLYPDRVVTVYLIAASFFVGVTYSWLKIFLKQKYLPRYAWVLILVLFFPLLNQPLSLVLLSYENYVGRINAHWAVQVTQDDLNAFVWIEKNTPQDAIFKNNYGDAGIWLPGIAYRKTIVNDSGPYEFDELRLWRLSYPSPDYVFIGSKHVFGNPEFTLLDIESWNAHFPGQSKKYELVFESGNSKVFKVL